MTLKKIIAIFEIPVDNIASPPPHHFKRNALPNITLPEIYLQNVYFKYKDGNWLFNNLNLSVKKGEKIAIVGNNGSGKSTLLNIVAGLLKVHSGDVFIRGHNVLGFVPEIINPDLHYIPQDFRPFNLSFRENLTFGCNSMMSDDSLCFMIKNVGLEKLLQHMSKGLDTLIGEHGIRLSGGEKQRLAIARALLLQPNILLLDETLQSLDTRSEKTIINLIYALSPTVMIVSHRPSLLKLMDRIIKIEEGKIIELKSHNIIYKEETEEAIDYA